MMYSESFIDNYIRNQILIMESSFLRASNIYRYAMYRYKKACVLCINRKMYKETREAMRRHRLKEIIKQCLDEQYKKKIPTAEYMKFE